MPTAGCRLVKTTTTTRICDGPKNGSAVMPHYLERRMGAPPLGPEKRVKVLLMLRVNERSVLANSICVSLLECVERVL